ncbi:MAG: VOC family protein [Planctomycetota bacterium]|jgi:catechol 2,3-dioxygenase-like lactoylglutathione lyase family enzyme
MSNLRFDENITFIYTDNIDASREFYGDILMLPEVLEQSNCFVYRVTGESYIGVCGTGWAMPQPMEMEKRAVMLTLITDKLEEWDKRLKEKSVKYEDELNHYDEYKITRILVRDPSNYLVEIMRFDEANWARECS